MLAHGFTVEQLVEVVRAGLATATAQRVKAGAGHSQSVSEAIRCLIAKGLAAANNGRKK
jgi:hypothetical protein